MVKILYAEDDRIDQIAFEQYVKNHGLEYDYIIVDSAAKAKQKLNNGVFDVIITDYNLGDGDAFDLFKHVQNNTPVIFVTGANDLSLAVTAMKSGAYDFLVKDLKRTYLEFLPMTVKKAMDHQQQQELLKQKNDIIYRQKEQLEYKNTILIDSIDYAKNIQDALLPQPDILSNHFPEHFILYKPKDIVSGDFFWVDKDTDGDSISIAAADCTGHGVPGAFMSLLGHMVLDDVAKKAVSSPAEILKHVNTQLMTMLRQEDENRIGKFGMDIALIKFDKRKEEIIFSGARNPLILIRNGQMNEIKADRISIGSGTDCSFTDHALRVKKGDMIYLYSDGYQDQMGGAENKKFLAVYLKELLLKIHTLRPEKQKEELNKAHMEWRSHTDQTDDILILGLKV